jgi:tetratricopeptide (TPR) repeat protein
MRRQNFPEAIKLLQQAAGDSRIEGERLAALGECFIREKKNSLAQRNYELAVEKVNAHDSPDLFKKVHYTLARLYEEASQREKAEEHYTEVLGVDYEYRDTLKRLEDLQGGNPKHE